MVFLEAAASPSPAFHFFSLRGKMNFNYRLLSKIIRTSIKAIRAVLKSKAVCCNTNFKLPPSQRAHAQNASLSTLASPLNQRSRHRSLPFYQR
ncbi:hypothetical protein DPMN_048454 [Dreissena polymorpha]|uniref:Uncharacterized protein n=1 Tax=Dreissena polymorpha TaxID=45954 RepID=A0A9D4I2D4_DREPO|nr:hypothetical protein DPMN_048454 [Dreissena polymorpha]